MKLLEALSNWKFLKPRSESPRETKADEVEPSKIYAIGDIHGRLDLLGDLFSKMKADLLAHPCENPKFVFVGDYIDRGPDNDGVLSTLISLQKHDNTICLRGNHEQLLLNFLKDASVMSNWRRYGALETLESYNVPTNKVRQGYGFEEARANLESRLPQSHLKFLLDTQLSFETSKYFFCHAGVNPARSLARQTPKDLLWIRQEFLSYAEPFEKIIVHGHTPVSKLDIRSNRINVDTGAYETNVLSCAVLEGDTVRTLRSSLQHEKL